MESWAGEAIGKVKIDEREMHEPGRMAAPNISNSRRPAGWHPNLTGPPHVKLIGDGVGASTSQQKDGAV